MMNSVNYIKRGIAYGKAHGGGRLVRKALEHGRGRQAEAGYESWLSAHLPSKEELLFQRKESEGAGRKFSVLVPIYRTPENFLREMIESVLKQSYGNLELCLADGSDGDDAAGRIIREYAGKDARVKYRVLEENDGISGNTNAALRMAEGEFICLLDHDDLLAPNALYELNRLLEAHPKMDVAYSDEDKVDFEGKGHFQPHFKPDFNLDLLRSNNYICHLFCVRRELAQSTGGFRKAYDGAQDYDFILRCTEKAREIGHIAKILYHWRCHPASTAANPESKMYAYEAGKRAVEAHLSRCGIRASVKVTDNPGFYRVRYALAEAPRVTVIVQGRFSREESRWLKSRLLAATDYPNVSIYTGTAALRVLPKRLEGKQDGYLLFLNRNCYPMNRGWLMELVSHAVREDAGCVTGRIYGEDKKLLHAGEILGMYGLTAASPFRGYRSGFYGYMHKVALQQDFSVVTGECLLASERLLAQEEELRWDPEEISRRGWNVKLCLKAGQQGLRNIYTPFAVLELRGKREEEPSFADYVVVHSGESWAEPLGRPDPAYNECLSLKRGGYVRKETRE